MPLAHPPEARTEAQRALHVPPSRDSRRDCYYLSLYSAGSCDSSGKTRAARLGSQPV